MSTSADINMVIFYNHYPVMTCKPKHIGFMGIFIKDVQLDYPAGTLLEVGFIGFDEFYHIDGQRISMVVNNSDEEGTGLMLVNYKIDNLYRWKSILSTISNIKAEITANNSVNDHIGDDGSKVPLYSING